MGPYWYFLYGNRIPFEEINCNVHQLPPKMDYLYLIKKFIQTTLLPQTQQIGLCQGWGIFYMVYLLKINCNIHQLPKKWTTGI